jgi:nucleolar protein 56
MQSYWFGDLDPEGCHPFMGSLTDQAARLESITTDPATYIPIAWENAIECGYVADRDEYLQKLRNLCFFIAEAKISAHLRRKDIELLQMVRMLDELDEVINLLTERAVEWYRTKNPSFSRKYRSLSGKRIVQMMKKEHDRAFAEIIADIEQLQESRTRLMHEVTRLADTVLPNCSALIGGLVAGRLLSRAGSLEELARLPASSIQVLGAQSALFSHMRSGSPSPKHGIIFQHRRVHNASREFRGRVARVLAAKLGIAARIDYFRQEIDHNFLKSAQEAIDRAGGKKDALD